jgi:hypothetical protein
MDFIEQAAEIARTHSYDDIVTALQMATVGYLLEKTVPHKLTLYTLCAAHQYKFATLNGMPIEDVITMVREAAKKIKK